MTTRHAMIVGGGIGGLGAALGLHRAGWRVTVLERADEFRPVGAGLVLQANGLRCLDELGVGDTVRRAGRLDVSAGTRRADGRWLARIGAGQVEAYGIHRAVLHEILLGALPADVEVCTGTAVTETTDLTADLVVGADGINSAVRRRLWPEASGPQPIGVTAWRGIAPARPGELDVAITWGRGAEFGVVPLADGRVYWFAAVNGIVPGPVDDRFRTWHDPVPALIDGTPEVLRDELACLGEPLSTYRKGNVVLLGDAAHAMTPNLGQGANQALEDAVVLAAAGPDEYDRLRRPRSQQVAKASRMVGRTGQQLENPLAVAVRNTLMRVVPARLAIRSMARYSDWYPPRLSAG